MDEQERNGRPLLSDRQIDILLTALKEALRERGEHRLFRAGKLTGLFPSRVGAAGEAATYAVEQGLLETIRTETRGKSVIEWVRLSPDGVEFLHAHDSPRAILRDLRQTLRAAQDGVPRWLESLSEEFQAFMSRCAGQLNELVQRLDALSLRIDEAMGRADDRLPGLSEATTRVVPWATDALQYLDQRQESGSEDCPLPELFAALRRHYPDLSMTDFHAGLRRLHDVRSIRLSEGKNGDLQEPEYALIDGAKMMYFVGR